VFDGEIVVMDDIGRSDFNRLQERARRKRWYEGCPPVAYCVFDILYADGKNVMSLPLARRKVMLEEVLQPLKGRILVVGEFPAEESLFAQVVEGLKLEGFVAKKRDSTYQPGVTSNDWRKVKRKNWQEGRKWTK
jgi:bifunctional non-homologous end joining protein LigD